MMKSVIVESTVILDYLQQQYDGKQQFKPATSQRPAPIFRIGCTMLKVSHAFIGDDSRHE